MTGRNPPLYCTLTALMVIKGRAPNKIRTKHTMSLDYNLICNIGSRIRWVSIKGFFFFHLTYSRWTSSLPSCLWSQRIFPSLPGSRLTLFLSRCKVSTLTTRQPMVEFYLLTFPRFPLRKKKHKSYFGKNRTHDFRTSRCAAYLLDHSGDIYYNIVKGGVGRYILTISSYGVGSRN